MSEIIETLYEMEGVSKVRILFNLKYLLRNKNDQSNKINAFLRGQTDIYYNNDKQILTSVERWGKSSHDI